MRNHKNSNVRRTLIAGIMLAMSPLLHAASFSESVKFDIQAQALDTALLQFSKQTGITASASTPSLKGKKTAGLTGEFVVEEALKRLLANSGLVYRLVNEKTVVIAAKQDAAKLMDATDGGLMVAQTQTRASAAGTGGESAAGAGESEMVVTGSHIRQVDKHGPSPVTSYDIEDIRASGAMTVAGFLSKLPQTYGGISAGRGGTPNELNLEYGQRNENQIPFGATVGGSPPLIPLSQTGVSGVSLRSLGAGSTLVLVDGRRVAQSGNGNRASATGQGFVDLNTIPLGLIERIDIITDGASAIYGADAVAGVVNIILKKNWSGTELASNMKFTQDGGAGERQVSLTTGFGKGNFRGTAAFDYYQRDDLMASQRDFSSNLDHSNRIVGYDAVTGAALYGRDQRIQYGTVPTVQAQGGTVPGDFNVLPGIRVVLTPQGFLTTPGLSDFTPATTIPPGQVVPPPPFNVPNAQGQRHFDPAGYLQLVPESERHGVTANGTYSFSNGMEGYGTVSYTRTRGDATGLPPYSSASPFDGLVQAAYNPFGQDVVIGMVHLGFGPEGQRTETDAYSMTAGLRGSMGATWHWDAGARWQRQDFTSRNRRLNTGALPLLFNNPDPAKRLNPFIDYTAPGAPDVSALYQQTLVNPATGHLVPLVIGNSVDAVSKMTTLDLTADGSLFDVWGGPVRAAVGTSFERPEVTNTSVTLSVFSDLPAPVQLNISERRTNVAAFGELSVPLIGTRNSRALIRRFDVQLAGRLDEPSDADRSLVPKVGFSWVPVESVLVRASYSEGFRAPSLTENQGTNARTLGNFADPRRGGLPGVLPFERVNSGNPGLVPERSTNEFYGIVWDPSFARGLNLQVNYYRTVQKDAIQLLNYVTLINNEALFPGNVVRGEPTAQDIANGYPGAIEEVLEYPVNFGEVRNESMDFLAEYRLPWEALGRWRISLNASHTLVSSRSLTPGAAPINDVGDTYSGPKWKGLASVYWTRGVWTASVTGSYLNGFTSNNAGYQSNTWRSVTPAVQKYDARVGYTLENGLWRGFGKDMRLDLSVENLTDKEPPFMDVIYSYNGALHSEYVQGRTWGLSLVLPF